MNFIAEKCPLHFGTGTKAVVLFAEIHCREKTEETLEERNDSSEEAAVHLCLVSLMRGGCVNPAA